MVRVVTLLQRFAVVLVLALTMTVIGAVTAWAGPINDAACRAADVAWFNAATATDASGRSFWLGQWRVSLSVCNS